MTHLSPRNQLLVLHMMPSEIENVDTLFEICDATFNSRKDVYASFASARGIKSWARYYLLHEVQREAQKTGMVCSYHMAYTVALAISKIWFESVKE